MNLRISTAPHIRQGITTQTEMAKVIIALVPCAVMGVYRFGLQAALVLAISMVTAVCAEYLWQRLGKKPLRINDLSALVTGLILGLNLPPTAPWWMPVIGSAFAILIVKQLFGGLGDNFMNPAMAARAVLLASWPVHMTKFFAPLNAATGTYAVDALTSATPLAAANTPLMDLFTGNIPGAIGEVSKIMILLGLLFLLVTKVITWHIPVTMLASTALLTFVLGGDPLAAILSGGVLFGAVFMATDYTTTPMTIKGQVVFGIGAGLIVALIRKYGAYPEGVTYAILLMNIATPLIDKYMPPKLYGHIKKEKEAKTNA